MPWFECWSCGLRFGDDDELELPSHLCRSCGPGEEGLTIEGKRQADDGEEPYFWERRD
jgi:hypothetical protein